MSGPGPVGYLFHVPSKMLVHPYGGKHYPTNHTELVLCSHTNAPGRLQYRWVPATASDYGYIEHVNSGLVVRPKGTYVRSHVVACHVYIAIAT